MNAIAVSFIVLVCVSSGALIGMLAQHLIPAHHLGADSKDGLKLTAGLIATLTALVLSLLVASAKGTYDTQANNIKQIASDIVLVDRLLAHYGADAKAARDQLRQIVEQDMALIWPQQDGRPPDLAPPGTGGGAEALFDKIEELQPRDELQRQIQGQAIQTVISLGKTRFLMFEDAGSSISWPLLLVLVLWLVILFGAFGLLAPRNGTIIVALFVGALSVSGAVFLILELDQPFGGWMQISSTPMRNVLARLGQ